MKHIVISRLWFDSKDMMDKYLEVAQNTLVPGLKSQTCKNFEFGILCKDEHVDYVKKKLKINFTPFTGGIEQFREDAKKKGYTLQTRHDMDDWMGPDYIRTIQKIYKENKDLNSFVIHAQPIMVSYPDMKELPCAPYHDKRISMFATLCQKEVEHPIYKGSHGQLYKYAEKVFEIPKGQVKWVQHKDTVTQARKKHKSKGKFTGLYRVGNMELYDTDHNWISERNIGPVVNVLTRTFKRPKSFAACRESIEKQTYHNINHIVGSEVECPYCDEAIKLKKKEGKWLPWNLHMNDLGKKVKAGWVMYLDDDDKFLNETAVEDIVSEIEDEDQLLLWRVKIGDVTVPNNKCWGREIKAGQISGIGFMFHSKHLPVPWEARRMGDFHVIDHLSKILKVKWIDKFCTGTQGKKNNHGKVPSKEIEPAKVGGKLISVGTPVWNNANIYWLSIESLCRQETTYPWELIVMECPSAGEIGEGFLREYEPRLKAAGCQRVLYINSGMKLDLSTKWIEIAKQAKGDTLVMLDSDDYTHPLRVQHAAEKMTKPWYDTRYAWHYSIPDKMLILYDYMMMKNRWKTGFNIAIKTDIVRNLEDPHKNNGIHKWMSGFVDDKVMDSEIYTSVATTGANTVSLNRRRHFKKPEPPWKATDKTIQTIGLPDDIVDKLVNNPFSSALETFRAQGKVEVEFTKDYCRLWKKGERKRIPQKAVWNLLRQGYIKLLEEEKEIVIQEL